MEEVLCFLSVLLPEDSSKITQLPCIMRELMGYQTRTYNGSVGSRRNLLDNLVALQQYKNDLGVFSNQGPELSYSRAMRDVFPKAEIEFVERIGGFNWRRFKLIRSLQDAGLEEESEESKFHDSALGSSKDTNSRNGNEVMITSVSKQYAQSDGSVNSNMSTKISTMRLLDMSIQTRNPEQSSCCICKRPAKDVLDRKQSAYVFACRPIYFR